MESHLDETRKIFLEIHQVVLAIPKQMKQSVLKASLTVMRCTVLGVLCTGCDSKSPRDDAGQKDAGCVVACAQNDSGTTGADSGCQDDCASSDAGHDGTSDAGSKLDGGCIFDGGCSDAGCDSTTGWKAYAQNPVVQYAPTALDGIPGDPSVIQDGLDYVMFYGGFRGDFSDPLLRIFRATSTDGITWQKNSTPILTPGGGTAWDATNVETPCVLARKDGKWAMYYSGNASGSNVGFQIGLATSTDGITWTREGTAPVLAKTNDELSLIGPSVVFDDQTAQYVMLYGAIDVTYQIAIRRATSSDGVTWTRHGIVLTMDSVERQRPEDPGVMGPELLKTSHGFEMVYNSLLAPKVSGGENRSGGIFYAASSDGVTWKKHKNALYEPSGGTMRFDSTEVGAQSWLKTRTGYRLWYIGTNTENVPNSYDIGVGLLERDCR